MGRIRYNHRLDKFHISHLRPVITTLFPEEIFKPLKEYGAINLEFDGQTKNDLVKYALNFFTANHNQSSFLDLSVHPNETYLFQNKKSSFFLSKTSRIYNNLLLILAYSNLKEVDKEKIDGLVMSLLRHLRVEKELKYNLTFLKEFAKKKISLFGNKAISLLIDLTLDDDIWSDRLINTVVKAIETTGFKVGNKNIVEKIFRRTTKRSQWNINENDILPFYKILDETNREKFRRVVFERLSNSQMEIEKQIKYYTSAIKLEIISDKEELLFKKYCDFVKIQLPLAKDITFSRDGTPESPTLNYGGWNTVVEFAPMIHRFNVKLNKIRSIRRSKDLPEYLKWMLNPSTYNYEFFDPIWALAFSFDPILIEKFKSIEPLRQKVKESLAKDYNEKLAKLYFEHLVD